MLATTFSEDLIDFGDREFMYGLLTKFIPDGMQEERPELTVTLRVWAFHLHDDDRQGHGDSCGIILGWQPRVAGWDWRVVVLPGHTPNIAI